MKVAVFGLGYVGTVTAACLAQHGHEVWGVDVDARKVDAIAAGRSPVVEPGLDDLVSRAVAGGSLRTTTSPAEALEAAELSLVCVGTPSTQQGATDLSYIRRAVEDIVAGLAVAAPPASGRHTVVIRSTVPPGTVDEVVAPAFAGLPGGRVEVGTGMCPEFLREGSGVADFYAPPFVVLGTSDRMAVETVQRLFSFLDVPVRVVGVRTAEALKYSCNAFHATKVSFANEVGRLFRTLGVDSREVMSLFCEDTTLNISSAYLRPGFAFGGSCLPKDLRSLLYMSRMNSTDLPLLAGALSSNTLTVRDVVDRVLLSQARKVAVLGLSFKSDTDDLRESPNLELAETLLGKGIELSVYDPVVNPAALVGANLHHVASRLPHLARVLTDQPATALVGADLAVVGTTGPAVVADLLAAPPPRILDLTGRLGTEVESLPGYEGAAW